MKKLVLAISIVFGLVSVCYAAGPYGEVKTFIERAGNPKSNFASNPTTQARTTIWTPATGKKAVITDIILSTDTAGKFELLSGSTGPSVAGPFYLEANTTKSLNLTTPLEGSQIGYVWRYYTDINGIHSIHLLGYEE